MVETLTVVGTSPLLGTGIDRDKVPGQTSVLDSAALSRTGTPDLIGALGAQVPGVNLDSASGNPFQPTLFYDGFEASPLQGTPQGIAVYLNGVRFNQAFGDTVNWDLIPDLAIRRVNVEGSNPVFGLNALGGSVNVRLKDGFSSPGTEIDLSGGSFGQMQGEFQYGVQDGERALYVAGRELHQDGWRDLQSSDMQSLFADLGWRHDAAELHTSLTLANAVLNGPGSAPVQLLAADPAAQFTAPNLVADKFVQFTTSGSVPVGDSLTVQGVAYANLFQQRVVNGNTANDTPCNDGSGLLCTAPGVVSLGRGGAPIPAYLGAGPYAQLNDQTTGTTGYGGSVQATDTGALFGHANHLTVGASFDGSRTLFSATGLVGGLNPITRVFVGPGIGIVEPGIDVPVRVDVTDAYAGLYATDTLDLTQRLALTLSGRWNVAEIDLADQTGTALNGRHAYTRFNPAAGATFKVTPWLTAYAGYSEANRAPTPAELSCAGPADACSLANFFVGDPPLRQVVAHSIEAGLRGHWDTAGAVRIGYSAGLFHTIADSDIVFVNSVTQGRAFFTNVGQTRRQGVSARLDVSRGGWSAYAALTYTEASYRSGFAEAAGNNPAGDANGQIVIHPGDRLPGVPATVLKGGADGTVRPGWTAGASAILQSGQYLFGDEANLTPRLPGFFTLELHSAYRVTPHLQVFANVQNATDRRYYTFGTFAPTGSVFLTQAPGATNPRSYSLAAPIGAFGGIKLTF